MSDLNLNLDDLKDIEEAIKNSPESPCSEEDKREIERYNKRKEQVAKFKEDIKKVEELCDKDWAKVILKSSTKNMMLAQTLATDEIEEYPDSKRMTSLAELSNAITTAAKTVIDLNVQDEMLTLAKEKNKMREMEIQMKMKGDMVETTGVSLGTGSTSDMLKLLSQSKIEDIENAKKVS